MDGTLTLPVHDFAEIRTQLGIESDTAILEAILEMPSETAKNVRRRLHEIEMEIAVLAVAQPGAAELLDTMLSRGYGLGILTRNDEEIAEATLKASGLNGFFETPYIIGRETCAPKPLPDGVLHLMSLWNARPEQTVMVGDFKYDIDAGRRAGVRTIHFDQNGVFSWPELADHKITKLAEIAGLFG